MAEHDESLLLQLFSNISRDSEAEREGGDSHEEAAVLEELFQNAGGHQGAAEDNVAVPQFLEQGSLTNFFGEPRKLARLGSSIQKGLLNRFLRFTRQNESLPSQLVTGNEEHTSSTAQLTTTVVQYFVQSNSMKSVATVAESSGKTHKIISNGLQRTASAMVFSAAWMVGCSLSTWRQLFRSGRFRPVAVIDKMLYDETPLKMKLQEWNNFLGVADGMSSRHQANLQETYKYAKILRLDWQLGFVVWDVQLRRHKLVTVPMPVPLSAVDRNTAECLIGVIDQVHALVPELDGFFSDFGFHVRMPVIDRFAANLKAETFIRTRDPGVISGMFTCDVHKASGCVKNALSLNDDSLSGIINLGLSLEGSGSLDRMRRILQEIFADELQIVYEQPPGEGTEVFKHRQAVLRTFLP